jgi:hypothetical protein
MNECQAPSSLIFDLYARILDQRQIYRNYVRIFAFKYAHFIPS